MTDAKSQVINAINALPESIRTQPGAVFLSGWSALGSGRLYLIGLNPGGDPGKGDHRQRSIEQALTGLPEHCSSYVDEVWDCKAKAGAAPHQQRVRCLIEAAGLRPQDVFSANAIFIRTGSAKQLGGAWTLWREHFWPIHQRFLKIVQPTLIACLGNGADSSWAMLKDRAVAGSWKEKPFESFRSGKFAIATFALPDGGAHTCKIVGVPHPSRFPMPIEIIDFVREALT